MMEQLHLEHHVGRSFFLSQVDRSGRQSNKLRSTDATPFVNDDRRRMDSVEKEEERKQPAVISRHPRLATLG